MQASLIIIGDEILSGTTIDTNSGYIAKQLNGIGISISSIRTVSDTVSEIKKALTEAYETSNLVITTGGLGPTKDDKTKIAFKEFFDDELVLDEVTYDHLEQLLIKRNRAHLLEINKSQAEVLSTAKIIQNDYGTAPCQFIQREGKAFLCLPGVPYEVKALMKYKILALLSSLYQSTYIVCKTLSVVGIAESLLSQQIEEWEMALPENIALSYLPIGNRIKLKMTTKGNDTMQLQRILNEQTIEVKKIIGKHLIAEDGDRIEEILKEILLKRHMSLSVAESCTGGELSRLITSVPGCSAYYMGGLTAYHPKIKMDKLNIDKYIIDDNKVVSHEVASAMSLGAQSFFDSDIALSATGVAGPGNDTDGTPEGTVFYSIRIKEVEETRVLYLQNYDRTDFMYFVSQRILQDLVELLVKQK